MARHYLTKLQNRNIPMWIWHSNRGHKSTWW